MLGVLNEKEVCCFFPCRLDSFPNTLLVFCELVVEEKLPKTFFAWVSSASSAALFAVLGPGFEKFVNGLLTGAAWDPCEKLNDGAVLANSETGSSPGIGANIGGC